MKTLADEAPLSIDGFSLTLGDVVAVARHRRRVQISNSARDAIARCRALIEVLLEQKAKIYGVTTGFGKLRDVPIAARDIQRLQENLIRSHAAGVGQPFPEDVVRAAVLLRANTLCRGNSGVRAEVVDALIAILNDDIYPYVPSKGSVGASGDLAPLSHLVLVLMGDPGGKYFPRERRTLGMDIVGDAAKRDFVSMVDIDAPGLDEVSAREVWRAFAPIRLEAKEGLGLNNGTQFMTALLSLCAADAGQMLQYADLAAAMSLEAVKGTAGAYRSEIHEARPQSHQAEVAKRVAAHCRDSEIMNCSLRTAYIARAASAVEVALDALSKLGRVSEQVEADRVPEVKRLEQMTKRLATAIGDIVPVTRDGRVDPSWLKGLSQCSEHMQIARLERDLASVQGAAIAAYRVAQDQLIDHSLSTTAREDDPAWLLWKTIEEALGLIQTFLLKAVPSTPNVQDDYSFRCHPQVAGGAHRALEHVKAIVEIEINSATDNPLLFPFVPEVGSAAANAIQSALPEHRKGVYRDWLKGSPQRIEKACNSVIGGGNFHGQPISTAADYLAIAIAEVASIAERRIAHLVDENHSRGLPSFLIRGSGLNSGLMIAQYTAAALVSESKIYCHPASVDSIPTCANTEDHVSMGTIAARKCAIVLEHVRTVIAIELFAAFQAVAFHQPLRPGVGTERATTFLRNAGIERLEEDRVLYEEIHKIEQIVLKSELLDFCMADES